MAGITKVRGLLRVTAAVRDTLAAGKFFNITKVDKLPPTIASIGYSSDNSTIMIRGKDDESSVVAIYIDGVAYPGSTVSWDIPTDTRYIRLQAEDEAGNLLQSGGAAHTKHDCRAAGDYCTNLGAGAGAACGGSGDTGAIAACGTGGGRRRSRLRDLGLCRYSILL